jgi:hypothetical protein
MRAREPSYGSGTNHVFSVTVRVQKRSAAFENGVPVPVSRRHVMRQHRSTIKNLLRFLT